jgi:hypothetical protein
MGNQKRIVWMPLPSAPAEFFDQLKLVKTEEAFVDLLAVGKEEGWLEIFGVTEQDPRDITAVLQEHFKVKLISASDASPEGEGGL